MTRKEMRMASLLLKAASSEYGHHGCNDIPSRFFDGVGLTDFEKIDIARRYREWNGDPEEFGGTTKDFDCLPDFAIMSFLAHQLFEESLRL